MEFEITEADGKERLQNNQERVVVAQNLGELWNSLVYAKINVFNEDPARQLVIARLTHSAGRCATHNGHATQMRLVSIRTDA
jgi:hypothetical protein